jgi:hypothetical protein
VNFVHEFAESPQQDPSDRRKRRYSRGSATIPDESRNTAQSLIRCETQEARDKDRAAGVHLFIQRHGDEATAKARKMVEDMRGKGDNDGADTWLRIIVAIGELGQPATNARH